MKNQLLFIVSTLVLMSDAFADEPASSPKEGSLTVEIVINRYKEGTTEWDSGIGANSAPDVFGKIQLPERDCEISVHEDSYIVKQTCPSEEMTAGTPVGIQLHDRDTMRVDDVIAIGTMKYQGNPTEATIGAANVKIWYSDPSKPAN